MCDSESVRDHGWKIITIIRTAIQMAIGLRPWHVRFPKAGTANLNGRQVMAVSAESWL